MLRQKLIPLFTALHSNQTLLKGASEIFMVKLAQKGNAEAQAKRNAVTDHEAKFAQLSEDHGFQYLTSMKKNLPETGDYYVFEPNGSQRSPDFTFVTINQNKIQEEISVDLKHSLGKNIVLNDGWFEEGIIYVITYTIDKTTHTFLGLGERIPTAEEKVKMEQIRRIKKELNLVTDKNVGNLHTYIRFANSYGCGRFTESFLQEEYQHLLDSLASYELYVSSLVPAVVPVKRLIRRQALKPALKPAVPQPIEPEMEELHSLFGQLALSPTLSSQKKQESPESA